MASSEPDKVHHKISDEDQLRAQVYGLLSQLLHDAPDKQRLDILARLEGDETTSLGPSLNLLAKAAKTQTSRQIKENYEHLFIGVGRGKLVPYASYYLTGFLNEKPLAKLRSTMKKIGLKRRADHPIPEDHAAGILEVMSLAIEGAATEPLSLSEQKQFFEDHIKSWLPHFLKDLASEPDATPFYQAVASLAASFLTIEDAAFDMTPT